MALFLAFASGARLIDRGCPAPLGRAGLGFPSHPFSLIALRLLGVVGGLLAVHGAEDDGGVYPLVGVSQTPVEVGAARASAHANTTDAGAGVDLLAFPNLNAAGAVDHILATGCFADSSLHVTVNVLPCTGLNDKAGAAASVIDDFDDLT